MAKENMGTKINKLRIKNKDTLTGLAKKINYDVSNLSKVESGKYGVTLELLESIISVYGVDPRYFFEGDFTHAEGKVLLVEDLNLSNLGGKYHFTVDGIDATEEEIMEAVRLIRLIRPAGGD